MINTTASVPARGASDSPSRTSRALPTPPVNKVAAVAIPITKIPPTNTQSSPTPSASKMQSVRPLPIPLNGKPAQLKPPAKITEVPQKKPPPIPARLPKNSAVTLQTDSKSSVETLEKELESNQKQFGNESLEIVATLIKLGKLLHELKDFEKAIECLEKALKIERKLYGNQHHAIEQRMRHLGDLYDETEKYDLALKYYEEALSICKNIYPENHELKILNQACLATIFYKLGELLKAISYLKEEERGLKKHSAHDQQIGGSLRLLGTAWLNLGEGNKAKIASQNAQNIFPSDQQIEIANTLKLQGRACLYLGEVENALDCFNKAFEIYTKEKRAINKCSSDLLKALCHFQSGDYEIGQEIIASAVQQAAKNPPRKKTMHLAFDLRDLGQSCLYLGQLQNAEKYFTEALELFSKLFSSNHYEYAYTQISLAEVFLYQGKLKDCLTHIQEGVAKVLPKGHAKHRQVGLAYRIKAQALYLQRQLDQARVWIEKALETHRQIVDGNKHLEVAIDYRVLSIIVAYLGKEGEAKQFHTKAIDIVRSIYSKKEHPFVALWQKEDPLSAIQKTEGDLFRIHGISILQNEILNPAEEGHLCLQKGDLKQAIEIYTIALQNADENQNYLHVTERIIDLGKVYQEKGEWAKAAKLFNGAYALYQKQNPPNASGMNQMLTLMKELEKKFLSSCSINTNCIDVMPKQIYLQRRDKLKAFRQKANDDINQKVLADKILEQFSNNILSFINEFLEGIYLVLGPPPCRFAMIGLGSLSRKEMCPFSDLEFALLIHKNTEKTKKYFELLVKLFEIRVIHLGETSIKVLDRGLTSPTPRGFSFDDGGNTPLGKAGYVSLLGTPSELAQYQSVQFYEGDFILCNVLREAGFILGDEPLFKKYLKKIRSIVDSPSLKKKCSIRQERAMETLEGHLKEFEPRIDKQKEENPVFNIKAELYRLPNFLVRCLGDYLGIEEPNTWKKIDLLEKRTLKADTARHLKEALREIMRLRIQSHLYYNRECDDVFHPAFTQKGADLTSLKDIYTLTDEDVKVISRIHQVIFPLHRIFKEFYKTKDLFIFSENTTYEKDLCEQFVVGNDIEKSIEKVRTAVALDPNNFHSLRLLGESLAYIGKHDEAKLYLYKLLELKGGDEVSKKFHAYRGLAHISKGQKQYLESIELFNTCLELCKENADPHFAANIHYQIGWNWHKLDKLDKAITSLEKSISFHKKSEGEGISGQIETNKLLGIIWETQKNVDKGIKCYEELLILTLKEHGQDHRELIMPLQKLADFHRGLKNRAREMEYREKALTVRRKVLGNEHLDVAKNIDMLGICFEELGNTKKAIEYYEESLTILKKLFSHDHSSVAIPLFHLGNVFRVVGNLQKSKECHEEAIRIRRKQDKKTEYQLARSLDAYGETLRLIGEHNKALENHQEALKLFQAKQGIDQEILATCFYNMGLTWAKLKGIEKAIEFYEQALKIRLTLFEKEHEKVKEVEQSIAELTKN